MTDTEQPIPGAFYRDPTGRIYRVIGVASDMERWIEVVVFSRLSDPGLIARSVESFMGYVFDGVMVKRFTLVDPLA